MAARGRRGRHLLRGRPCARAWPAKRSPDGRRSCDLLDATDAGAPVARCSVDALVLEKVLRASVVASAPGGGAAAGLAQLYEATVNVAEKFDDPCGTDLAAARVLLSIHAAGERKKPDAPRVLFTGVRIDRRRRAALAAAGAVRVTRPATRRTSCVPSRCVGRPSSSRPCPSWSTS